MKKKIVWRGKEEMIEEVPTDPKILENVKKGYSYIPERERVYVRGRQWSVEQV